MKIKYDFKKVEKILQKSVNKIVEEKQKELNIKNRFAKELEMKILNKTEEELLEKIINCRKEEQFIITGPMNVFPEYIQTKLKDKFKTLEYAGYLSDGHVWLTGEWQVTITPDGLTYSKDKEKYNEQTQQKTINFGDITGSTIIIGNAINSNFSIDNSITEIMKEIDEKGVEDKEELKAILDEVKDFIENIKETKTISKNRSLFEKLGNHFSKHQWFYGRIVALIGEVGLLVMGGKN